MQIIVDHFNKYPLIGVKWADFVLFEKCFNLIKEKQHLTTKGLEQIVGMRCNLNKGLTFDLKANWPHVVPAGRPKYIFNGIPDPFWISWFVSGDSTFSVSKDKSDNKIGPRFRLIFGTCLHIKDKELLKGILNFFNNYNVEDDDQLSIIKDKKDTSKSNNIYDYKTKAGGTKTFLQIKNSYDIHKKVIPFFNKYPILGIKNLDFEDFKKVAKIIENKEHLTIEGSNIIINIVKGINLDRINN